MFFRASLSTLLLVASGSAFASVYAQAFTAGTYSIQHVLSGDVARSIPYGPSGNEIIFDVVQFSASNFYKWDIAPAPSGLGWTITNFGSGQTVYAPVQKSGGLLYTGQGAHPTPFEIKSLGFNEFQIKLANANLFWSVPTDGTLTALATLKPADGSISEKFVLRRLK